MRYPWLICACLSSGLAYAQEQPPQTWLQQMSQALETLNYEGIFIYRHDQKVETMRMVHGRDERGERERLLSLTGEAREIIRDRDILTCFWPGSKSVVVEQSAAGHKFPAAFPQMDFTQGNDYYHFEMQDVGRVAGMSCQGIYIRPQDQYRYGYRMCIALESKMLLKSEIVAAGGEVVEELMFTSIELLDKVPEEKFEPTQYGDADVWHQAEAPPRDLSLAPDPAWTVAQVPPGFILTTQVKRPMAANQLPVQHMVWSDGLASVSVFIAPVAENDTHQGGTRSGALNAYATVVDGYQVTVLGEVPLETVLMMAQSVNYGHAAHD